MAHATCLSSRPCARGSARGATAMLVLLGGLAGCGERTKVDECNALVGVINGGVEEIQRGTDRVPDGGPGADDLRVMAELMDGIAARAGQLSLSLPELQELSKQYQGMTREVGTAARELGTAFEKVDDEGMRKAQAKMEKAVQQEDALVESINKFCRTP